MNENTTRNRSVNQFLECHYYDWITYEIVIIFLMISYFCLNGIFVSVQTNKFLLEDMDITSKEYQELEDRMLEVEDKHLELYDETNYLF